jgi:hypothetical protein
MSSQLAARPRRAGLNKVYRTGDVEADCAQNVRSPGETIVLPAFRQRQVDIAQYSGGLDTPTMEAFGFSITT